MESALLYAKAWSKYTKELLAWVEKRLSIGEIQQYGRRLHTFTYTLTVPRVVINFACVF